MLALSRSLRMDASAIEAYKKAGAITAKARAFGASLIKADARLLDVSEAVERFIREQGAEPAFPCNLSIDENAAHDTPLPNDARVFLDGQVVKLDCGVHVNGYVGDTAITVEVGTRKFDALRQASQAALQAALDVAKPGAKVREVSAAVEATIRAAGYQPIVNLTGHSVDRFHLHAGLSIPNIAATASGTLEPGMAVAIEPFATTGVGKIKDAQGGGIYHYLGPKPQRDPIARKALDHIAREHPELPFAARWLASEIPTDKISYALRLLERSGAVKQYAILKETSGGQVAQFEHTILMLDDGPYVTTRG